MSAVAALTALVPLPLLLPLPLVLPLAAPADRVMAIIDDAISLAAVSASNACLMIEPTVGGADEEAPADMAESADAMAAASCALV